MPDEISISVVITNYNTNDLTLRCLDGLERHSGGRSVQMIVVDDASSEPLPASLRDRVDLVENPTNQGYVRSVNIGVGRATGDIVLLLDSDACPVSNVLAPTIEAFSKNPRLGALGYHLVDSGGRPTGATQPEPTALGLALGQALEARFSDWIHRDPDGPFTIHSCALAFRRQAFVEIGGFDEGFDFLDADTDFSMRLHQAGWQFAMETARRSCTKDRGAPVDREAGRSLSRQPVATSGEARTHKAPAAAARRARDETRRGTDVAQPTRSVLAGRCGLPRGQIDGRRRLISTVWNSYRS